MRVLAKKGLVSLLRLMVVIAGVTVPLSLSAQAYAQALPPAPERAPDPAVFAAGPQDSRPYTFYFWMNGNVTKAGIDADLEAMHKVGVGGLLMFDGNSGIPRGPVDYLSREWLDLVTHMMGKARSLGLKVGLHNAPGWSSSGGPWITPDRSMQQLVWTETTFSGGGPVRTRLPQPYTKLGYYRDIAVLAYPAGPGDEGPFREAIAAMHVGGQAVAAAQLTDRDLHTAVTIRPDGPLVIDMRRPFAVRSITLQGGSEALAFSARVEASDDGTTWRPVATVEVPIKLLRGIEAPGTINLPAASGRYFRITPSGPVDLAEALLSERPKLDDWAAKAGHLIHVPPLPDAAREQPADLPVIDPSSIIDLTGRVSTAGDLDWQAPPGRWTILRIGHTTTGHHNVSASTAGDGLEVDKLDRDAVDFQFDHGVQPILDAARDYVGSTFTMLEIDSYEAGLQTWTPSMPDVFKARNGYALTSFLPALTGRAVGSPAQSERFLFDFRKTLADLMGRNYYGRMKQRANAAGLQFLVEGYGPGPFDALQVSGSADVPMTEFWTRAPWGDERAVKMVASAAHVYGKPVVAAEAFTGRIETSRWQDYPYALKALGDQMFALGVNQLIFHRYAHQPNPQAAPGMTMGPWGFNFERTNTWFAQSGEWLRYLARAQHLLRQGQYAADVLYFTGEESPNQSEYVRPDVSPDASPRFGQYFSPQVPSGYQYDLVNADVLSRAAIERGQIVLPGGGHYRLLVMPAGLRRMTLQLVARLRQLVTHGMVLLAPRPEAMPGLEPGSADAAAFTDAVAELWGTGEQAADTGRRVGAGQVFASGEIGTVMASLQLRPDADCRTRSTDGKLVWLHRRLSDRELYFVSNQRRRTERVYCDLRVTGGQPELWNAEDGTVSRLALFGHDRGRTQVSFVLSPAGSTFISLAAGQSGQGLRWIARDGKAVTALARPRQQAHAAPRDNFTLLLWAKPDIDVTEWPDEAATGRMPERGKNYLVMARAGGDVHGPGTAVAGLVLGRNGAIVVERASADRVMPVLVVQTPVAGWTHVALVYAHGIPSLYLNGQLVRRGKASGLTVYPGGSDPAPPQGQAYYFEGNDTPLETIDRALGEDEIRKRAARGLPDPELATGPITVARAPGGLIAQVWKSGTYSSDKGPLLRTHLPRPLPVVGPWQLAFPGGQGAPARLSLSRLRSLSRHPDPAVRHYSGEVVYRTRLRIPSHFLCRTCRVFMDLGRVEVVASVSVNGKALGTVWKEPFRIDISQAIHPGSNTLEIRIANLWVNRLIGDAALPEEGMAEDGDWAIAEILQTDGTRTSIPARRLVTLPDWYLAERPKPSGGRQAFTTWSMFSPLEALLESGLLGPVRVLVRQDRFIPVPKVSPRR